MSSIILPSKFGDITLTICALKAPRYANHNPKRHMTAELGAFTVNGKTYGKLSYSFYTEGRTREDGALILNYQDKVAYSPAGTWGAVMTAKGWETVRACIETAVRAFLASPGFAAVTAQAEQGQRESIKANAIDYVARLQARIQEIQALAEQADTATQPEQLSQALADLWRKHI